MSPLLSTLLLLALLAQSDSLAGLKRDAVTFADGKMILEGYGLGKPSGFIFGGRPSWADSSDTLIQFKYHAEAPATGLVSRDYFVMLSSYMIFFTMFNISDFTNIPSPAGQVDEEFNIYLTSEGIRTETKSNKHNKSETDSTKWDELLKNLPMGLFRR